MIDHIFEQLRESVKNLNSYAEKRRGISTVDPVADGIVFAAKEVSEAIDKIEKETETLSTAEYADMHGVTPQSVCTWIRSGQLEASGDPIIGYRIPRAAKRVVLRKTG